MRKNYVLDTNVLLHDPTSINRFADNTIIIPIDVIQEIDQFKKELSDRGQNAREVSRELDALRRRRSLAEGVTLPNGGTLRVYCGGLEDLERRDNGYADTNILRMAVKIQQTEPDTPVIIVSKDINLRIRADALGLHAEDYESDRIGLADLYTGEIEVTAPAPDVNLLKQGQRVPIRNGQAVYPNEFVLVRPDDGSRNTALARIARTGTELVPIQDMNAGVCGIRPRNKEQHFALDALMNDEIKLVTIMGKAGTGKTLLAIAAGLHEVAVRKRYKGLLVSRPTFAVGKDIGFLPGGVERKLYPWMQPISDTLEFLLDSAKSIGGRTALRDLWRSDLIEIQPLAYIRGRSIANHYMVVDEVQNLTPLEVKTIITRVGHHTKVVMTGDPYQIDNPYVDSSSNGFNYVVNKFRPEAVAAHVELVKGERSELAELAANLL
jgi:PhoH-like ATPase